MRFEIYNMSSGNEKKCCVPNCGKTCKDNTLHQFPNPDKDPDRFRTWLYAIGGDILALDNNVIFKNRRVCHAHFGPRYHTRSGKISANAVPTFHLPGFYIAKERPPMDKTTNIYAMNMGETAEAKKSDAKGASTSSTFAGQNRSATADTMAKNAVTNVALMRRIKKLQLSKNKYAAQLKKALKIATNTSFQKALNSFTTAAFIFTMLQFREIKKPKMGRRFTKKEKVMALSLYKQGPKAYRFLRKMFVLPSPVTLSRILSKASLKPGINENIFLQLEKQAKKMNSTDKLCVLLFDEIALCPHFDYNEKNDKISGFVNDGCITKKQIADHALVFMIRGVQRNYKQPICYTFCAGTTPKLDIANNLKIIIKKLKTVGFKVLATVCDQGGTNTSAINYLINETRLKYARTGINYEKNIFEIDNDEVVPLFDPPHLIKGIRNNLLDKDLQCVIDRKQKCAKWDHVMRLYQENPAYKGLRLMPKLTEAHVNPKCIRKMKVKFATQIFSRTVATNMGYLAEKGILPKECEDTADVILFFDNLFDSVNGSYDNSKKKSAKPLLGPLTPTSIHEKVWKESKPVLTSMKFVKKNVPSRMVPSIKNWLFTLENIQYIKHKVFDNFDIKSIWMRHFNQDPLENFFGCIRSHGFRNNCPSCTGFESAFASLLINNLSSSHSPGSNCERDSATAFKSLRRIFFNKNIHLSDLPSNVDVVSHVINPNIIIGIKNKNDVRVRAQLVYVSGYILRKTKHNIFKTCDKCKKCFYNDNKDSRYINMKEHLKNKKCLTYPSDNFISLFSDIQDVVTYIIKSEIYMNNIKNYIKSLLYVMVDINVVKCEEHKKESTDYIFDLTCRLFLANWCRDINKILNGKRTDYDNSDIVQKMAYEYRCKRRK